MDTQHRGTDWRSILLLIFSFGGMALAFITAIGTLVLVAINESVLPQLQAPNESPLPVALTAFSLIVMGMLLMPAAWLSLQRLRGKELQSLNLPALRPWAWIAIPSVSIFSMVLASLFYDAKGASWYVPLFHVLSIGLPIYMVIRIGVNHISLGSTQRTWGIFGSGMMLSPMLAVVAEVFVIIIGIIIFAIFLGLNPEKVSEIQRLVTQLEITPDLDSMVYLLEPILSNPLTLLTALLFLSVLVPIIEESAKSIGVWLISDRLTSPAQGFAMGVLSGAGFALAESLFASASPDDTWALMLSMRAISGSMHMLASGLVGWGIAYARLEKRYLRMIGLTILAMLLHGFWNAGAVLGTAGGIRITLTNPDFDMVGILLALAGFGLLFILMTGMVISLFTINRNLRTPHQLPEYPVG